MNKIIQTVIRIGGEATLLIMAGTHSHWSVTTILTLQMIAIELFSWATSAHQQILRDMLNILETMQLSDRAQIQAIIKLKDSL